jgi:hypothetical protein
MDRIILVVIVSVLSWLSGYYTGYTAAPVLIIEEVVEMFYI